ncbi:exported hypothetical protein [Cupriavidus oxalaticus]|uniref:Uncharacterized protein n=1 Tax=Cupriavidus oxalaticus TaxID=96344 RepID=A0A375FT96_9BURK|nr:exported hypothetical protein [Cupriavidus oxalaticus]
MTKRILFCSLACRSFSKTGHKVVPLWQP